MSAMKGAKDGPEPASILKMLSCGNVERSLRASSGSVAGSG